MRLIISFFIIYLLCVPGFATDTKMPEPYSKSAIVTYSELPQAARENLDQEKDIYISCGACELCNYIEHGLLDKDYLVRRGGPQPGKINITINSSDVKYWEFVRTLLLDEYSFQGAVHPAPGPVSDLYYKECVYNIAMTIPGRDEPVFEQETKTILHVQPDTAKPADIPTEEELSAELLPVITGILGNFDLLEVMLNADKSDVRKQAVELICEIGNPKAVDVLEKRLKNEKSRSVKNSIKKAVKKFK